jgi:hypothetical protein
MALDESRALFQLTRLSPENAPAPAWLQEVWFKGVHSDVGGGNGNPGLNSISLNWMYEKAKLHGLPIIEKAVQANLRDGLDARGNPLPQAISDHKLDAKVERKPFNNDVTFA